MKNLLSLQKRVNRFRYGMQPTKAKRKIKRLRKVIGWAFDLSVIGRMHNAATAASIRAIKFPNGGRHTNSQNEGEPIISGNRPIAFIAPYPTK